MMYKFLMKIYMMSLAATGCLFVVNVAYADQCQAVEEAHAARARAMLANRPNVIEYCEPCGEKTPGKPFVANTVEVKPWNASYREVYINGKAVDLAYTFVQVSPTEYDNLAILVGCPASSVSTSLEIADETSKGAAAAAGRNRRDAAAKTQPTSPVIRTQDPVNPFDGAWEGVDSDGDIYTFKFSDNEWESSITRKGVAVPFYRGTYAFAGARVELQVTEEVDTKTMKWMRATTAFPTITGRLNDNALKIVAFTDADLTKTARMTQDGTNRFIGLWEGVDGDGDIFTFKFSDNEWESSIESKGITIPFYKGAYTFTSASVDLQVIEEVDMKTMKWMRATTTFPIITGRLNGDVLNLGTFTEADLKKQ